jgi:hypothetical protein
MQRPDRAVKLRAREDLRETVVKCTLRGSLLLPKDSPERRALLDGIAARVDACSRRTANASVALNLFLQRAFHGVTDVASVSLPEFWDQTFLRQLMLGTADAVTPVPEVASLFALYPELLHSTEDRSEGDRNVYSAAAIKLGANVRTHLAMNTDRMIRRLIFSVLPDKDQAVAALYAVHGWSAPRQGGRPPLPPLSLHAQHVVSSSRRALGLAQGEVLNKKWFRAKGNPLHCVRFLVLANRSLQSVGYRTLEEECSAPASEPAPRPSRLCTLVPICKLRSHNVTLDTHSLYGLAKEAGLVRGDCPSDSFVANGQDHWRSIFNVDRLEVKRCRFTGTIETDGVAVCFHFLRPKEVAEEDDGGGRASPETFVDPEKHRVIGVDPGRTNILYCVEKLPDGKYKKYVLSRAQYYAEAGIKAANAKSQAWNRSVQGAIEKLSQASPKGASLPRFLAYLETWLRERNVLYAEHSKARWAQQRMRLYGGKKRVFATFLNRVEQGELGKELYSRPVVMAYGSARFAPGGKGELAVPTSAAYKQCATRFRCVAVDEFRTTQLSHVDGTHMQKVAVPSDPKLAGAQGPAEMKRRDVVVRGLLWCGSTSENGKFVNRDMNAAINILKCGTSASRPSWLRRPSDPTAALPKQRVVKLIPW